MEEEVTEAKVNMISSLERNFILERELDRVSTELEKYIKWNTSSQYLTTLTCQEHNSRRDSGYHSLSEAINYVVRHARGKDNHLYAPTVVRVAL